MKLKYLKIGIILFIIAILSGILLGKIDQLFVLLTVLLFAAAAVFVIFGAILRK